MFTLCLSALLFAAPIPKTADQGTIAVLLSGEKSELLLLEPNGKEIKRVDMSDLEGDPVTVRLFQDGKRALVKTRPPASLIKIIGDTAFFLEFVYLMTLDGSEKPKQVFNKTSFIECLPSRDGTKLFVNELDKDKLKPKVVVYKSSVQDLKTGKVEPVPIPPEYRFVDISADNSSVLLSGKVKGVWKSAVASTTKWKLSPPEGIPSSAQAFTRNGELAFQTKTTQLNNATNVECSFHDFKTGADQKMNLPSGSFPRSLSFDKEGIRYAFFDFTEESTPEDSKTTYRVFICDTNSNNHKIIFETSKQKIRWLDWR